MTAIPHRRIGFLVAIGLIPVVATILFIFFPREITEAISRISPGCIFHRLTGLSCPGCGGTRAAIAMIHGDWIRAFSLNFLWLPTIIILLVEYANAWVSLFRTRAQTPVWSKIRLFLIQAYAIFVVVFSIARNIWGW